MFFKVFFHYIRKALQEVKAVGPVSTEETGADKTSEESKETGKDDNRKKGNGSNTIRDAILTCARKPT